MSFYIISKEPTEEFWRICASLEHSAQTTQDWAIILELVEQLTTEIKNIKPDCQIVATQDLESWGEICRIKPWEAR
jgi:hypothetical protein